MVNTTFEQRHFANRDAITTPFVTLLELREDSRSKVIRIVENNENVTFGGETYNATEMQVQLPNSGSETPTVGLQISNVSRELGKLVSEAKNDIGCRLILINTATSDIKLVDTGNIFVLGDTVLDDRQVAGSLTVRSSFEEPTAQRRTSRLFFEGVWIDR